MRWIVDNPQLRGSPSLSTADRRNVLRYGRETLSDRSEQAPRSLQFGGEALSPSHLNGYIGS